MNIALWIVQGLLATLFTMAGQLKAFQYGKALTMLPWVKDTPEALVHVIGTCELLGAFGLILPWASGVQRRLTPLAASGLTTIMALAVPFHLRRGEMGPAIFTGILGLVAALVAWGRFRDLDRAG